MGRNVWMHCWSHLSDTLFSFVLPLLPLPSSLLQLHHHNKSLTLYAISPFSLCPLSVLSFPTSSLLSSLPSLSPLTSKYIKYCAKCSICCTDTHSISVEQTVSAIEKCNNISRTVVEVFHGFSLNQEIPVKVYINAFAIIEYH